VSRLSDARGSRPDRAVFVGDQRKGDRIGGRVPLRFASVRFRQTLDVVQVRAGDERAVQVDP
jgi:hypothetical protein